MERTQRGITLIELMIAVAIVGILAAIAYPSYRNQVVRSTRTEAKVALEQRALALEKCFTRYLAYDNGACVAALPATDGATTDGHYLITSAVLDRTFTLTATPQGSQANDAECGTFSIDEAGRRQVSVAGAAARCW